MYLYRLRWKTEIHFKHLKTNRYNLEDLRMADLYKIRFVGSYILAILTALDERKEQSMNKSIIKLYTVGCYFPV